MNDALKDKLPAGLEDQAAREAAQIVDEVRGAQAALVATTDGFDIACVRSSDIDTDRIAALASSIAAIGQVVSAEARLGAARSVTVDTDAGFAVVYSVQRADVPLVIIVVAGPGALVGEVNYRTAAAARALAREDAAVPEALAA